MRARVVVAASVWIAGALCVPSAARAGDDLPPVAESPADVRPGKTALLTAPEGMTYVLRVPRGYDRKKGARLIVFLHGSNMNGQQYLASFEARGWADDAILCCPNGETGEGPGGANNFTFGSAPLVADVTRQVQAAFEVPVTYVGGHSQGGFLTHSVILRFPELYQGAIPMAGDCWSQNEPNLWEDDEKAFAARRRIPVAVIHGRADPVVRFSQGEHAYDVYRACGWQRLRLFAPDDLGHQFMLSPVAEALEWLDALNGREPRRSLALADDWAEAGEWGWVRETCRALREAHPRDATVRSRAPKLLDASEKAAKAAVDEISEVLRGEALTWVPLWLEFERVHGNADAAAALVRRIWKRRDDQRRDAARRFDEALGLFRSEQRDAGFAALEALLAETPHSYHAYYAWKWLSERE